MYLRISLLLLFIVLLFTLSFLNISYSQQVNLELNLSGFKQIADIRIDDFYNPALYSLHLINYETQIRHQVYLSIIIEIVETVSKYSHLKSQKSMKIKQQKQLFYKFPILKPMQ